MRLAECIAIYESAEPVPAVLTPKGAATSIVFRLRRQLLALNAEDRAVVLAQMRALVADLSAPTVA